MNTISSLNSSMNDALFQVATQPPSQSSTLDSENLIHFFLSAQQQLKSGGETRETENAKSSQPKVTATIIGKKRALAEVVKESNTPNKRMRWSSEDKRIINACYAVWQFLESSYDSETLEELKTQTVSIAGTGMAERYVSLVFFDNIIRSPSLRGIVKNPKSLSQQRLTDEVWKCVLQFYREGHSFGEEDDKIKIVARNESEYHSLLESYQEWTNRSQEELHGAVNIMLNLNKDEATIQSEIEGNTPLQARPQTLVEAPAIQKVATTVLASNEISISAEERAEALDLILTRLHICKDLSELDLKLAYPLQGGQTVEHQAAYIQVIQKIWEEHLLESYNEQAKIDPWKKEPIMALLHFERKYKKSDQIDWKWIASQLSTKDAIVSVDDAHTKWQQLVVDRILKNSIQ